MRRLSIIDLSSGHQPIGNEDGSLQIVFNGEIYNYVEIREELRAKGHRFATDSDTEVIVHSYEEWGVDCLLKFRGMFCFALWDSKRRRLFLARDPLGIKPLFFRHSPGSPFLFGSEIKSLLQAPAFKPTLSSRSVNEYFAHGFVYAPNSIYNEVRKLKPGEYAFVHEDGSMQVHTYWRIRPIGRTRYLDEEDAIDELLERLRESVRLQLRSDVPVGAFLSGGVDSSAVVASMVEVSDRTVHTFSIGFAESTHDESPYAREVSRRLGTKHSELYVEPGHARDVMPDLACHFDEPFADSSAIPTYYLSQLTRQQVTVALSGDGGDELFAGYSQFLNERLLQLFGLLPPLVRGPLLGTAVGALPAHTSSLAVNYLLQRIRKVYAHGMPRSPFVRSFLKSRIADEGVRNRILSPEFLRQAKSDREEAEDLSLEHFPGVDHGDPVANLLDALTSVHLPDDMLTKVDRASMAHSLEVRVPFLDHTFAEFAAGVPVQLKLRGLTTKYLLKKALCRYLPDRLVYRKKQGFALPLSSWFQADFSAFAWSALNDSGVFRSGILAPEGVKGVIEEHRQGLRDHTGILYAMVFFAFWYERWQ